VALERRRHLQMAHVGEIPSDHDVEIGVNKEISNCRDVEIGVNEEILNCCNVEMGVGEET
jgi:hypothetical protein